MPKYPVSREARRQPGLPTGPAAAALGRSIVRVDAPGARGGTGFLVGPGLILTCAHVVVGLGNNIVCTTYDGVRHAGRLIGCEPSDAGTRNPCPPPDLAVLAFDSDVVYPTVVLDENIARLGDELYGLGFTGSWPGASPTPEPLLVRCVGVHDVDGGPLLKLDEAEVSRGMSGGPLLSLRTGRVCAVIKTSRDTSSPRGGWAIPIATVKAFFPDVVAVNRSRGSSPVCGDVEGDIITESADLLELTHRQRKREIDLVSGSPRDTGLLVDRQYVPDLFVPRPAIESAWERFLDSSATTFAAVGAAGRGKTTLLCALAGRLGENAPCLFYHGSQLNQPLFDLLAEDLQVEYDAEGIEAEIARRVADADGGLFVFIDALNECTTRRNELRHDLDILAKGVGAQRWPIRIIVSCRTNDWPFWIRNERRMLSVFGRSVYTDEELAGDGGRGVAVREFDRDELDSAWTRYSDRYGLRGELPRMFSSLFREPFFLRLVAEVYAARNDELPMQELERQTLLDRFFSERFPSPSDNFAAMSFLFQVSRWIIDSERPTIPSDKVRPSSVPICRRLLDDGVLIDRGGSLAFRFEIVLEHVVARFLHGEMPDNLDNSQIVTFVMDLTQSRLLNMPGIIENLLLAIRNRADAVLQILNALIDLGARWQAVACTVASRIDLPPYQLLPTVMQLAAADNYLVRTLSANTVARWSERGANTEVAACIEGRAWESRETVAQALGRARQLSDQGSAQLWELAGDFHWRVRRAAGYALRRRWSKPAEWAAKAEILARLDQISWRHKHAVCAGLLGSDLIAPSDARNAIESMSRDENHQVRWCIANYLSRYTNAATSPVCSALVADVTPWVRSRMVSSLVAMSAQAPGAALPMLKCLAVDPSIAVRLKVARELSRYTRGDFAIPILRDLANDTDTVAFAANYSLGQVSDVDISIESSIGREFILRIFRERIARREIDVERARFSTIQGYVSDRVEIPLGNDPYMQLVDTMCSLTVAAMEALQEHSSAAEEFMTLLVNDEDEAIRWALVLFLVRYGTALSTPMRISILECLARDPHWWVRREVAHGLAEFRRTPHASEAARLLEELKRSETQRHEPCSDEVSFFLDQASRALMDT